MSANDARDGTEVGGGGTKRKPPQTTYVMSPEASKGTSSVISMAEWLKTRRNAKPGSATILRGATT